MSKPDDESERSMDEKIDRDDRVKIDKDPEEALKKLLKTPPVKRPGK